MEKKSCRILACLFFLVLSGTFAAPVAAAYSVLTHQAVIDAAWAKGLQPLLLQRFPKSTAEDLRKAHAFAYGGAIVQDMGYYPFGSTFFTDLTHYVRSGDFVAQLLRHAKTQEEYAFALGALAHYNADIFGHPIGTNHAVPLVYPKIGAKYGNTVTYAEDPLSHIKTEFGFDVLEVARGNYAPESYHDFIGFEVADELLEKAFLETYGLELKEVFVSLPLAVGTYRYTIKNIFPELTKAAWQAKKNEIQQAKPGATRRAFVYRMSRASYRQQWGRDYERPQFYARALAWVIKMLPKIGPLRPLAFVPPTPAAEEVYFKSFNATVDAYSAMLQRMRKTDAAPHLRNLQLDTGQPTAPGTYKLADETYAKLLAKLSVDEFKHLTPALRHNIMAFYKQVQTAKQVNEKAEAWKETQQALARLEAAEAL
ncbi:zinc dependent phospholipase C family protein [Pontibacter liquoris]|uniref:zinc dependent phospholipase C family protein n=1 Tax=Pontibacter liquoris TaxID=2905677 RepID=UPI001FA75C71|nr:zinc dependent phospholipase C family protein [Pontibacter liquoris]